MTTTTAKNGRLGNQIIRNLAVSLIAEKNDLFVHYSSYDLINQLGIELYSGKQRYSTTLVLNSNNYFSVYEADSLQYNLNPNGDWFQTKEITNALYTYLRRDKIQNSILFKNPFRDRYKNNNDVCIHIRLTDVAHLNPGINYYLDSLSNLLFDKIYIATDDPNHPIIIAIQNKYRETTLIEYGIIQTIQFASTCKYIILSHGSFSAVIGYLSFFSDVYYPEYDDKKRWCGDMFSIGEWNKIPTAEK
jgi:hypothetical protein